MVEILFPLGEINQEPNGEFLFARREVLIYNMQTVEETRRIRLRMLVAKYGSMAELCQLLGYARTETATLTRILNANIRHDRGGKPYNMGGPMARQIEEKLDLPIGWMDTPPTYAELHGEKDVRSMAMAVMERLPQDQWPTALRLLDALNQPTSKTGTSQ
jgi:hypothetical protein